MAKAPTAATIDKHLARLKTSGAEVDTLRAALAVPNGRVVAAAAKLAAEHGIHAVAEHMADAFAELCVEGPKRDPGCRGKLAVTDALKALEHWEDRVFVDGLHYEQREGYGGDDTAALLRASCGLAHVHFMREDTLDVLAELLADGAHQTRVAAAQGIAATGRRDATALLRFKLLTGDPEIDVLAACIEAMFDLAREASIPFVMHLLETKDERGEAAVVTLGSARVAEAFEPICAWAMTVRPAQRQQIAYVALALLRHEPATQFLIDAIAGNAREDAIAAARALATFKDDPSIAERLRAAASTSKARAEIEAILA